MTLYKQDFIFLAGFVKNIRDKRIPYDRAIKELMFWCRLQNERFDKDIFLKALESD